MAHKKPCHAILTAILTLIIAGCASDQNTTHPPSDRSGSGEFDIGTVGLSGLDLGEDWEDPINRSGRPGSVTGDQSSSTRRGQSASTGAADRLEGFWAIVLFTFTGPNHGQNAADAANQITLLGPENLGPNYTTARTQTTEKGSMVLFGAYPEREDEQAQIDLDRLRRLVGPDGQRFFARIIFTYIDAEQAGFRSPHDLRTVREEYGPNRVLYTLDIAVWSPFDDPRVNYQHLKQEAEAYCRQLRNQGHEAYFHHNERAQASNVTVGIFGLNAVDAATGIYSDEVMNLARQFPVRRNNGEPLQIPIDRSHPDRGTRLQSPVLVEVPD